MNILEEAEMIINGPRREAYGPVEESFKRVASVWNVGMFKKLKEPLDERDVALMLIGLKYCRQANSHARDNLVDICGYTALLEKLTP